MSSTPVLGIPLVASQQASPEVTLNLALLMLQALSMGAIGTQDAPPVAPDEGDVYVIGSAGSGDWLGFDHAIAIYYGAEWRIVPGFDTNGAIIDMGLEQEGLMIWRADLDALTVWDGTAWTVAGAGGAVGPVRNGTFLVNSSGEAELTPTVGPLHLQAAVGVQVGALLDAVNNSVVLRGRRANGTYAAKTALADGNSIVSQQAIGHDGVAYASTTNGSWLLQADGAWTAISHGVKAVINLTAPGTITAPINAFALSWFSGLVMLGRLAVSAHSVSRFAAAATDWQTNTPVTGFALTVSDYVGTTLLTPAGTLASGTLTMPADPVDGQEWSVITTQIITALTVNGNTGQTVVGAPATLAANDGFTLKYRGASPTSGTWYRKKA